MKRSGPETTVKETEVDQDHFKVIRFYREKMNQQPLHSALRSFNIQDGVRMSGVYEIHRNNEVSVRIFVDYGLFGNDYLHGEISRDCTRVLQKKQTVKFRLVCISIIIPYWEKASFGVRQKRKMSEIPPSRCYMLYCFLWSTWHRSFQSRHVMVRLLRSCCVVSSSKMLLFGPVTLRGHVLRDVTK